MGFKDKFMNAINTIDKAVNTSVPLNKAPSSSNYTFILKSHFKGFKSFPIVVYSSTNKEALVNNSRLSDPLPGKEIKFIESNNSVKVYIDNLLVGWICEEEQIKQLNNIEAVFAMLEIKPYPSEFNKNKNEQRIKIFVKYKDN